MGEGRAKGEGKKGERENEGKEGEGKEEEKGRGIPRMKILATALSRGDSIQPPCGVS